ncbi:MAG: outer membrane lipoprotein carrier protein LolA [Dysgonamonadaceae bacterium]|jgi:outer membrane lipoprotein-sorting protein|nr:outer membrane lipoprotein carrier protein LolA [Dysgonamonadaceae bacterium]
MKYLVFLLSFFCVSVFAQDTYTAMENIAKFNQTLATEAEKLTALESDFKQTKYIGLLSESIVSSGKFFYKKADKISMEYASPVKYLLVINGQKIKIVSDGKKNVYDLKSNKMMAQTGSLLSACMTGNLAALSSEYALEYKENAKFYLVVVSPKGSVKNYLKSISIYFSKKDYSVEQLRITEPSDDYTEYAFTNKKKNPQLADAKFSVK